MPGRQYTGPKTPGLGMSSQKRPNATGKKPWVCMWECESGSVWVCEHAQARLSQDEWLYAQWFTDTNLVDLQGSIACAHTICCLEQSVNHARNTELKSWHTVCCSIFIFLHNGMLHQGVSKSSCFWMSSMYSRCYKYIMIIEYIKVNLLSWACSFAYFCMGSEVSSNMLIFSPEQNSENHGIAKCTHPYRSITSTHLMLLWLVKGTPCHFYP